MDFARKQLEKYGWTDGKGLGRREDGIAEPLRPKLKRSATGLGHAVAADLNDHWWSHLYNEAASNVQVKNKTQISTKDIDAFNISSSSWKIKKKAKKKLTGELEGFVKTAVLTSGGVKTERLREESESDEEVAGDQLTDEQLFAACGGRTAHKGARHGLRAIGKLARIEHQERELLKMSKYKGYSKAIDPEHIMNDAANEVKNDTELKSKKKKKRKPDAVQENVEQIINDTECEMIEKEIHNKKKKKSKINIELDANNSQAGLNVVENSNKCVVEKKHKKKKGERKEKDKSLILDLDEINRVNEANNVNVTKKRKKSKNK